ncbi:unnamed protein product [Lactuca saligna]|uniref:Uncharacterized protein n=1 Tax=Lactuca saligna TaxID=75948 RepID=A0AA35V4P8_LACSI|nr:unnamed protein product [Lactuca saligna]
MRMIETLDQKIHNTIEACLSPMNQKIDDFILSLSNLDEQVQHQLDSLRSNIENLSKSNYEKNNSSSGDISSLQKTVQLLVDEVKAIKQEFSTSDLCALQQKVSSTNSKLELILAKLSGSNERPPEAEKEKVQKTRSSQSSMIHQIPNLPHEFEKRIYEKIQSLDKMVANARPKTQQNTTKIAEKDKELIRQQGIKDPSLKVLRRKDVHFSKPIIILEPTTQSKLSQDDPKDKGKHKIIFKSKKELAKETQMKIDEELAKKLKGKELNSKQEVVCKGNLQRSRLKKGLHGMMSNLEFLHLK